MIFIKKSFTFDFKKGYKKYNFILNCILHLIKIFLIKKGYFYILHPIIIYIHIK